VISYAVTELLEGETLKQRISVAPLPPRKAVHTDSRSRSASPRRTIAGSCIAT
jgi:hypothetical protein